MRTPLVIQEGRRGPRRGGYQHGEPKLGPKARAPMLCRPCRGFDSTPFRRDPTADAVGDIMPPLPGLRFNSVSSRFPRQAPTRRPSAWPHSATNSALESAQNCSTQWSWFFAAAERSVLVQRGMECNCFFVVGLVSTNPGHGGEVGWPPRPRVTSPSGDARRSLAGDLRRTRPPALHTGSLFFDDLNNYLSENQKPALLRWVQGTSSNTARGCRLPAWAWAPDPLPLWLWRRCNLWRWCSSAASLRQSAR